VSRALILTLALFAAAGAVRAGDDLPPELRGVGFEAHVGQALPADVELRDEDDQPVRLGAYFGRRPLVLVFAYFKCPMLCTQVLNGLVDALRALPQEPGREFDVAVVSFDARERAPVAWLKKKGYVESYGRPWTAPGWHFLTGRSAAIDQLTQAAGFRFRYDPGRDQFAHASGVLLVTPQGRICRYLYGITFRPLVLQEGLIEAAALSAEAQLGRMLAAAPGGPLHALAALRRTPPTAVPAAGGIPGTPAAAAADLPTILYCFEYDPATGRIRLAVMRAMRVAGVVAVLCLATGFVWMRRRASRARSASKDGPC
jgi:protein SCO1/2